MSAIVQGIDRSILSDEQGHALDILTNLPVNKFNQLKELMELDVPGIVGPTTLAKFLELCKTKSLDLSEAGVNAFKDQNNIGNTGAVKGIIGPQTAEVYFNKLTAAPTFTFGDRRINQAGLHLVEEFEGYHRQLQDGTGRVMAYVDPVGIPTIGFGHISSVHLGQVITHQEAEEFLRQDLAVAESAVSNLVVVPLNNNQFSALVSFCFNLGAGALGQSTLLKLLNQKDYSGAADQFLRWVMGGRQVLPGLVKRRKAERELFLS